MNDIAMIDGLAPQLAISAVMVCATTFVHAIFIAAAAVLFRTLTKRVWGAVRFLRDALALVLLGLILMIAHSVEIARWAAGFLRLGIFADAETAVYFASVAYTTLGFGDVLIGPEWRLLSGAAAANGLLLFGLSAAFMVETAVKLRLSGDR